MQQEIQQQQMQGLPQYSNELLDAEATIRAIDAQYQSIDWDSVEDKGQAALYRQQLNDAKQQMLERREQVLQKQKQEQQQAFTQRAAADWQETIKAIPEWRDNNKVQSDKAKIKVDINEYGFRDEEIFTITDPRVIRMLRDFTLMKEKLNTAGIKAKEVRKRGIAVPNRARNQIPNSQRTALSNKIKRAKKTQDRRDINSAVTDLLNLPEG
jgi:ribosomal protein L13E